MDWDITLHAEFPIPVARKCISGLEEVGRLFKVFCEPLWSYHVIKRG